MQALRLAMPALAFAAVLSSVFVVLVFAARAANEEARRSSPDDYERAAGASSDRTPREDPEGKTLSASKASTRAKDVAGKPIPGLPRYPGSVLVGYSEHRGDGLAVVRAEYLSKEGTVAVRDFYAGVFRSRGWRMANAEYAGNEWYLLGVMGAREAGVEVSPRAGGSRIDVEFSRPRAGDQKGSPSAGGSKR